MFIRKRCKISNRQNSRFWFCTFGLFFVTFAILLPFLCGDLVYSSYYVSSASRSQVEDKVMKLNSYFANKAQESFPNLIFPNKEDDRDDVDVVIGIVSVPRQIRNVQVHYLTQTVVAMLENMNRKAGKMFARKALFICDVFAGPGEHVEAKKLGSRAEVKERFQTNDPGAAIMDTFDKEKEDYAFCIDVALTYKASYVLMIEDDVLPVTDLFGVLEALLDSSILRRNSNWAYLKLFYPDRWKGYGYEFVPLVELCGLGLIGGSTFLSCAHLWGRHNRNHRTKPRHFAVGFIYAVLIAVTVGRQYVTEWRRVSKSTYTVVPAPDCCTPAILYSSQNAKELSEHLKMTTCSAAFPVDAAIEQFASKHGHEKYLVEPNLMQHIGMLSSIKTWSDRPLDFLYRQSH